MPRGASLFSKVIGQKRRYSPVKAKPIESPANSTMTTLLIATVAIPFCVSLTGAIALARVAKAADRRLGAMQPRPEDAPRRSAA